ncbi:MAG: nitroreductase family protein [Magnetococcales bacterium]|nr:nitroreductase family protein [Magnetococcales bacterium]
MEPSVRRYHQASKHAPDRYAPGPGRLDWASQPDPFRYYQGTLREGLPLQPAVPDPPFAALWQPEAVAAQPMTVDALSCLLANSLGLAVWKAYGNNRWALRCHPSSGNLHPIEAYLIAADPFVGVHHYFARDHLLERRWQPERGEAWRRLWAPGHLLLALTLVHERETWKYGLRSYRYCQLNLGHAAAAIAFAAAALGWRCSLLWQAGDETIRRLSGLPHAADVEAEHPGLLLLLSNQAESRLPDTAALAAQMAVAPFLGKASRLTPETLPVWPGIEAVEKACHKAEEEVVLTAAKSDWPPLTFGNTTLSAAALLRGRRSGQSYDPGHVLPQAAFFRILDRLLPRLSLPPWALLPHTPLVHPLLLVHRVEGVVPGRYLLLRDPAQLATWQGLLPATASWQKIFSAPDHLPLYLLQEESCAEWAGVISCQQEIAADGFFSLGMLADFALGLQPGAWGYRALHWEAGILGQILYLAAEEEGVRGTGIGCFFDDLFHRWLGLQGDRLQTIYHFTIGMPIADQRILSLSPYAHLTERR